MTNPFGVEHTGISKGSAKQGLKLVSRAGKTARKDMERTAKFEGTGGLRRKTANAGFRRNNQGINAWSRGQKKSFPGTADTDGAS